MGDDSPRDDYDSEDRENPDIDGANDDLEEKSEAPHKTPEPTNRRPGPSRKSLIDKLPEELATVVAAHAKFEHFDHDRVWDTASLLVRYGIPSLEIFRTTDDTASQCLFEDLRKSEKLAFTDLALVLKLNRHIPPRDQKTSEGDIRFTDLDIPRPLSNFKPNLSALSSAFHHGARNGQLGE